ncbi:MAG: hypothetical protein LBI43_00230 [Streptococcaceae bacterium]|jgi:TRAP-type C4-dicarboxylate transport system substrate-binding protein|nr:hypothetical protein [Streptococcaceae bacterium]
MLFALILAAIFSLILAFYLHVQVATYRNLKAQEDYQTAQLMVTVASKQFPNGEGFLQFRQGIVEMTNGKVKVVLADGSKFDF